MTEGPDSLGLEYGLGVCTSTNTMGAGVARSHGPHCACAFPLPMASDRGTPAAFPFFICKAFLLFCLPWSLCQYTSDCG